MQRMHGDRETTHLMNERGPEVAAEPVKVGRWARMRSGRRPLGIAALVALVIAAGWYLGNGSDKPKALTAADVQAQIKASMDAAAKKQASLPPAAVAAYQRVNPSLVMIQVDRSVTGTEGTLPGSEDPDAGGVDAVPSDSVPTDSVPSDSVPSDGSTSDTIPPDAQVEPLPSFDTLPSLETLPSFDTLPTDTAPGGATLDTLPFDAPRLKRLQGDDEKANSSEPFRIGSGVIINAEGLILTAHSVVAGATSIKIVFADGTEATGTVVNEEPENDIATLVADRSPEVIVPAIMGGGVRVGDAVYAVGHPYGLQSSFTAGVVSATDRSIPIDDERTLDGLIQFDAAVNPGNSGGPLLNQNGQVVGIVSTLPNPTSQSFSVGVGFAVTIEAAGGAAGGPPQ